MTHYATCKGCQYVKRCPDRKHLASAIKGLGITTLRHKCDMRKPMYSPGTIVEVITYRDYFDFGDHDSYEGKSKEWIQACIVRELKHGQYLLFLTEEDVKTKSDLPFMKAQITKIRPPKEHIEPCKEFCRHCEAPMPWHIEDKCWFYRNGMHLVAHGGILT